MFGSKKILLLLALLVFLPHISHAANFVTDSFTDTPGTALESHTGEVGATWTKNPGFLTGAAIISDVNRVHSNSNLFSVYYASGNPASADYSVSADVFLPTGGQPGAFGLMGREATNATTYYLLDFEGGGNPIKLYTLLNGSVAGTTATFPWTPVSGNTYHFELSMIGSTITAYLDGVQIIQKTDSNITTAGKAGLFFNFGMTNTTGYHIDNFSADDTSGIINVGAGDLWENGYDNVGNPRQSPFSFLRLTTDANKLRVTSTTSLFSTQPGYASLGLRINGVDQAPFTFSADGLSTPTVSLPAGNKTIDIIVGPQNRPSSTILGTFINSFELLGYNSYSVVTPVATGRLLIYGDSITAGFTDSTNNGQKGYATLLRNAGRKTMVEAYGYRALYDDAVDNSTRTAFVSRISGYNPNAIWLAIGTNDYGLNKQSAASFGTAYAALLDDLHAALPTTSIFCQTPIVRSSESAGANSFNNSLPDYRAQIATACNARSWTTLVDGTTILTLSDLSDGIHPSTSGHLKYANFVAPYVAIGGGFSRSLSASSGILGQSLSVTLTRALGSTFISGDSITVNWGDGNTSLVNPIAGNPSVTATHAYSSTGGYSISFTNNQKWPNPSAIAYSAFASGSAPLNTDQPVLTMTPETPPTPQVIPPVIPAPPIITPPTLPEPSPIIIIPPIVPMPIITPPPISFTRTLQLHDKGNDVKTLQTILHLTSDGVFGKKTYFAVIQYQKSHNLVPDGAAGPKTRAMFQTAL